MADRVTNPPTQTMTFRDLSRKVFAKAKQIYSEATVQRLVREAEKHPELMDEILRGACRDELRSLAWEFRKEISKTRAEVEHVPKTFTDGEQARITALCGAYYNWILPIKDGPRLPDATKEQLGQAVEQYDSKILGATKRRDFLKLIYKKIPDGKKVSDVFKTEEQLRKLEQQASGD